MRPELPGVDRGHLNESQFPHPHLGCVPGTTPVIQGAPLTFELGCLPGWLSGSCGEGSFGKRRARQGGDASGLFCCCFALVFPSHAEKILACRRHTHSMYRVLCDLPLPTPAASRPPVSVPRCSPFLWCLSGLSQYLPGLLPWPSSHHFLIHCYGVHGAP